MVWCGQRHLVASHQIRKQVAHLLGRQRLQQSIRHQRLLGDFLRFDLGAFDGQRVGLRDQSQRFVVFRRDDACQHSAVGKFQNCHAEVGGHDRAGIDDVLQEVVDVVPLRSDRKSVV